MKWLFLVHQVRTTNSRERVKVWRMTKKIGAVLYRNSVYVLPYSKERLEDFQWLSQQIRDSNGDASVFVSESSDEKEDKFLKSLFDQRSKQEFSSLMNSAEALISQTHQAKEMYPTPELIGKLQKQSRELHQEFTLIQKIDFFHHPLSARLHVALKNLGESIASMEPMLQQAGISRSYSKKDFQGKTWSTRSNIHIDRLSSAWLIRRFIDPKAKFIFKPETKLPKGTITFDAINADFGHQGDNCTFETLLKAFRITDPSLASISQIVHDIDLKDQKFGRSEASGIDAIVRSLSESLRGDHQVLETGSIILDALYKYFLSKRRDD